jgi:GMP synthase-like glutamine amidotransferase
VTAVATIPAIEALVLQHEPCETPGVIEDVLVERCARITRVEVEAGEQLPDWRDFDLVVAMGGPMGAYEDHLYPWLAPERALLAGAAGSGIACLGVCLGSQLLAAAIGGRAYQGPSPELGVLDVTLTAAGRADPVLSGLAERFPVLQWHGDTFDIPADAAVLASSPAYPHQAFRWRNAFGVQFHAEVTPAMADEWSANPGYVAYLERALGPGGATRVFSELRAALPAINHTCRVLTERLLDEVAAGFVSRR